MPRGLQEDHSGGTVGWACFRRLHHSWARTGRPKVREWLTTAAGFIGLAVGRTVFWNPVVVWRARKIARKTAVNEIACRYREFVTVLGLLRTPPSSARMRDRGYGNTTLRRRVRACSSEWSASAGWERIWCVAS